MFLHLETEWYFCAAIFKYRTFPNAYFSSNISGFSAGLRLSRPADREKKARAYYLLLKKGRGHFWLLKKVQGTASSEKHETWILLNFERSQFFSFCILWRVRFSHFAFCEESVFLILNFVKSPFFLILNFVKKLFFSFWKIKEMQAIIHCGILMRISIMVAF